MNCPLRDQIATLRRTGMTKYFDALFRDYPGVLMKNLTAEEFGADRRMKVEGRWATNFGSDSFLGLDQDARLHSALRKGLADWGAHNGTSRAFTSVAPNVVAEQKLARWLQAETALIYPSVSLANHGAIPALVSKHDVIVVDRFAHNSIHEGVNLASARGVRTSPFAHNNVENLEATLRTMRPYRHALICVDGVYSMSGQTPPLKEMMELAMSHHAILYIDDAHGTGVLGRQGRGTVLDALGSYENCVVVGSLSKAFSCLGGYVACDADTQQVLKIRSNPLIFGGPVPPPYLEAICAAVDILDSDEYDGIRAKLDANVARLHGGISEIGFQVQGGLTPILSIHIGDEQATMKSGRFLFEQGYYVQSVIFPAVPHGAGVLRIQVNANHSIASIDGLLGALQALHAQLGGPELHGEAEAELKSKVA